jgi:uncharacterized protein
MSRRGYSVDLIRQMAECDANYIRLLKLVPQLQAYRDRSFSELCRVGESNDADLEAPEGEPEKILEGLTTEFCIADLDGSQARMTVEIRIVEAFRYTSTLEIVQRPELKQFMTNPSMLVRVYHDANTAEVVSYQGHRNLLPRYSCPNPKMYQPDEKMQVNRFLGEWLSHCLEVGRSLKAPDLTFST